MTFPAEFILVAAMNPCPSGYRSDPRRACSCTPPQVEKILWKIIVTVQQGSDPKTPIGEILKAAGSEGILLESEDQGPHAGIPLYDDLIDYLIERSPKIRADCRESRERMDAGQSQTHEEVRRRLAE